jgi:hypothetical protein
MLAQRGEFRVPAADRREVLGERVLVAERSSAGVDIDDRR